MTENKKMTLGELELRDLVDLGLRMPDGSTELFEVVDVYDSCVTVMTKNIIDFVPFNKKENKHSSNANSYIESSVRSYLRGLYQTVIKENELLENYTIGNKEFFLASSFNLGLMGGRCGWQAFRDDDSRVKYPGAFAVTRYGALGLGKSDWYWTSTPTATSTSSMHYINADGALIGSYACNGSLGVAPAIILKPTAPVILIDNVWHLCNSISEALGDKSHSIKIGDWIEVTHTVGADAQNGILLGDCFEVTSVNAGGNLVVKLPSTEIWYLLPDQVRKIEPPLPYYKKAKESADFSERLKGYYQHTAIEALKVYHTAHKAKEERIKALNKVVENIQELIKLEENN